MSRPERDEAARDRPGRLIVVSGLAAEARIAAAPGIVCIVGTGARLRALLERELARGGGAPRDDSPAPDDRAATRDETAANRTTSRCVPALLSFGLAGGLAPALEA